MRIRGVYHVPGVSPTLSPSPALPLSLSSACLLARALGAYVLNEPESEGGPMLRWCFPLVFLFVAACTQSGAGTCVAKMSSLRCPRRAPGDSRRERQHDTAASNARSNTSRLEPGPTVVNSCFVSSSVPVWLRRGIRPVASDRESLENLPRSRFRQSRRPKSRLRILVGCLTR